ncbi:hypothetical protein D3C78_1667670 [compost metagenome]
MVAGSLPNAARAVLASTTSRAVAGAAGAACPSPSAAAGAGLARASRRACTMRLPAQPAAISASGKANRYKPMSIPVGRVCDSCHQMMTASQTTPKTKASTRPVLSTRVM